MLTCIPDILDWTEVKKIRAAVAESKFQDGKKTAGYRAKRVKHNLQMDRASEHAKEVKAIILTGLRRNPTFQRVALPKAIRPPLISRYQEGMNYGLHVDDALMGSGIKDRTDISVTVFLSDPAKREILHDVYQMREKPAKLHPDEEEAGLAFKTYANLLRMWSE